jgi:hypothetical protein
MADAARAKDTKAKSPYLTLSEQAFHCAYTRGFQVLYDTYTYGLAIHIG